MIYEDLIFLTFRFSCLLFFFTTVFTDGDKKTYSLLALDTADKKCFTIFIRPDEISYCFRFYMLNELKEGRIDLHTQSKISIDIEIRDDRLLWLKLSESKVFFVK